MSGCMTGWRWLSSAALLLTLTTACSAEEPATNRLAQVQEQVVQAQTLLSASTNDAERAHWQERLNLLAQDRTNIERRLALDAEERTLAERQAKQADVRLRETLRAISTDVNAPSNELYRIDRDIHQLKAQRSELEKSRRELAPVTPVNAEHAADLDQQLRVADEEIAARVLDREVAEARAHLVTEASRIDEFLRNAERNPPVSLRLLREKQAHLNATQKGLQDVEEANALGRQRQEGLAAALALSQEKMAHLNAEEALLNRKSSGLRSLFQNVPLLFSGNVEKKYLYKRMPFQQQQLAAMEEVIGLNETLRNLLDGEAAYLRGDRAALLARYEQRLLWPAGLLAALVAIYIVFGRLLTPRIVAKDHQIVGRRVTGYLCSFAGLLVLVAFFFEDLRSVATILGIASAAVVIALQDMCSSFAGWFVIMSGHKFAVGHRVEIDGQHGDVIDIQLLRTTLVEINNWLGVDEPTGRILVVPNSFVFRSKFFNSTYLHPFVWSRLDITVTYETPAVEVEALFRRVLEEETREEFDAAREAAKSLEHTYGVPDAVYKPKLYVFIADSGVQYRLVYCTHCRHIGATRTRINTRLLREFEADPRLQFAYPTERHIPTPEKGGLHVALERSA